jgi:hypothetical protein
VLEQPRPALVAHHAVDHEADEEPDGPHVARRRVRPQRRDPDGERGDGAEHRRHRHLDVSNADVERNLERTAAARILVSQPDDRELRGGESEQDAEAEEAREERVAPLERRDRDDHRRRDPDRGEDLLR